MKRILPLGLGLVALALATTPLAAQVDFSRELDQVDAAVLGLASSSTNFQADLAEVVRLHTRVVALRQPTDPARFDCLMDHASLLLGIGDLTGARRFTAEAVAQAQAHADALKAADASVTAALLAQRAGDLAGKRVFLRNALDLALTPTLTTAQTTAIAKRLYAEAWKAAANGRSAVAVE